MPPDENEPELKLAPIDGEEESQYNKMMRETYALTQNILQERPSENEKPDTAAQDISERELIRLVVIYLRMMADGKLEEAEQTAGRLKPHAAAVKDILRRMQRTERPEPELASIPPRLLMGLMKNLSTSL